MPAVEEKIARGAEGKREYRLRFWATAFDRSDGFVHHGYNGFMQGMFMKRWLSASIVGCLVLLIAFRLVQAKPVTPVDRMITTVEKAYKISISMAFFHLSTLHEWWRLGRNFSFNRVAHDAQAQDGRATLMRGKSGEIIGIHDGKKTPLILGSIPRTADHIRELKKSYNLDARKGIAIYSLNRKFERDWAGLSNLINPSTPDRLHKYPTIDHTAPSLIDLIRAIRDLKDRDNRDEGLAYVHCKAGRARSATAVIAYLMVTLHEAGYETTPDELETYLKRHRFQVGVNNVQRHMLLNFQEELLSLGTFDLLYARYADEIKKRDQEVVAW